MSLEEMASTSELHFSSGMQLILLDVLINFNIINRSVRHYLFLLTAAHGVFFSLKQWQSKHTQDEFIFVHFLKINR